MKKIITLLSLILIAEVAMLAALFGVLAGLPKISQGKTYDNPFSRSYLKDKFPKSLTLVVQNENHVLTESTLAALSHPASRKFTPNNKSSLANYFYAQTRTNHPWTAYGQTSGPMGLPIPSLGIGNELLKLAAGVNHEPQDAVLVMEDERVTEFTPHRDGLVLDLPAAQNLLTAAFITGQESVVLPVFTAHPQRKLADLNNLGIEELISRGQSDFSGSSRARITNIRAGAARYRGLIVKPGEEFSFNSNLGEVDAAHGFLPELVIKPEGATPEFGGGLCQVSTTAFRAAFFAGLPITARRNHSYAVKYYEWIADDQPRAVGLDATIYSGVQDMKFINDTPGHILIWTEMSGNRLYFDFYGTKDDRQIVVDGPHPYDRRASGAVKSKVTRTVTKTGEAPKELIYNSIYVPPKTLAQAVQYPEPPKPPEGEGVSPLPPPDGEPEPTPPQAPPVN